jgi:hypothetical protein
VARQVWRAFCRHGTKFIAFVSDRGTRYLSGRELIRVYIFDKWPLAQCRGTRFISCQKFIRVHKVVNGEGAYPGAGMMPILVNKTGLSRFNNSAFSVIVSC